MFRKPLTVFLSLRTAIWLLLALLVMLFYGSLIMPSSPEFSSMNSISLFNWLREKPLVITWWLYGSIILLFILTANTIVCSVESLIRKQQFKTWLLAVSPQIIHIGFLCILLAHLLSSMGSFKRMAVAYEGSVLSLVEDIQIEVKEIKIAVNPSGYVSDWGAVIEYSSDGKKLKEDSIKPNSPSLHKGFGIYIKDVRTYPVKTALLEVSREPGAIWALIGGIFFIVGMITLLILKIKKESY